ncbi:MAG: alpha-2-macroglobulin family protein [Parvibaculaceae bacterium]
MRFNLFRPVRTLVVAALIALPFGAASAQDARTLVLQENADYYGFDYETVRDVTPDECKTFCLKATGCKAFTHSSATKACYLKSDYGAVKRAEGALTGRVDIETTPSGALDKAQPASFLSASLTSEAARYRSSLIADAEEETQGVNALTDEAAAALVSGDARSAMNGFASAVGLSPDEARLWTGLARAVLAVKPDGDEQYQLPETASSAAQNAYLASRTTASRAEALEVLAQALEKREMFRPALEAYKASLAFRDSAPVRAAFETLRASKGFRVIDNTVDADSQTPRICVQFSEDLVKSGTDYGQFLTVNEQPAASVNVTGKQLCVGGLSHGDRYRIALRAGLPAAIGEVLEAPVSLSLYIRDRNPAARFTGDNFVLPAKGKKGIPVVTINTTEVALTLYRVGDRGLARLTTDNTFLRQLDTWDAERIDTDLGEKIWEGALEVKNELNKEVTTSFPLEQALPDRKPGVYVLVGTPKGDKAESWQSKATQWFVVSDIGLLTAKGTDGLAVFTRSLASAGALEGIELQLVARSNEVLGTAVTDGQGFARFEPGRVRGTGAMAPALLMARSKDGDFVFLNLDRASFDLTDRGVAGRPAPGPLDLFLYTERGIYRAGETVHVASLLRDDSAKAVVGMPLTFIFERPDGKEDRRVVSTDRGLGAHWVAYGLEPNAMRGTWRVKAHTDPKEAAIAEQKFLVEDFVPDRIEFDLATEAKSLIPGEPQSFNVDGRFLYGAKASDLNIEGEVAVTRAHDLEAYKDYVFGLEDETAPPVRQALEDLPKTDENGLAKFDVALQELPEGTGPAKATVTVRLREGGGRAVERAITLPVQSGRELIGIKPAFQGREVKEGSDAAFEIIAVAPDGSRQALKDLSWTLVRIERNYQWYRSGNSWNYEPVTYTTQVANGKVDVAADAPAKVQARVDWGRYRLDVESAEAEGPASSIEFTAGWYVEAKSTETPDGLEIALDKATYRAGEVAKLSIAPRFAGEALIAIGADRLTTTRTVSVPKEGTIVELPVSDALGAGAYVTVTLVRPGQGPETHMPARAIGVKWLAIEPGERRLAVKLDAPQQAKPRESLSIPVSIDGLKAGEKAYVMVAAVDVGILNLTRYEPPAPDVWYYGQRQMGLELRDFYGQLIDGSLGAEGRLRTGGDESALGPQGSPPTEPLLAFFSGPVEVDAAGKATVRFDLPQFNGTARVMAVAWAENGVGHSSTDVIIRDPIVVTASIPRFLAPSDEATMRLEIANTDAPDGDYQVTVETSGEVASGLLLGGQAVKLEKAKRASVDVPLLGRFEGDGTVTVRVAQASGPGVEKVLAIKVRSPDQPVTERTVLTLKPDGSINLEAGLLSSLKPESAQVTASVSRTGGLDVPSLLAALDRYPYGCAEQTTSRALPLLYVSELAAQTGEAEDKTVRERVQAGIDRVLGYQSASGSFGLWSPGSGDLWLDAYVTDFLTRARELNYKVPDLALTQALDNLQNAISYDVDLKAKGAEIAYALYVLARNRRAPVGDLRYYVDTRLDEFASPLAKAQLGAALGLFGEKARADTAFSGAFTTLVSGGDNLNRADYGTRLRDGAAALALAAETRPSPQSLPELVTLVNGAYRTQRYTSTQENAWLLLAARALKSTGAEIKLEVNGAPQTGNLIVKSDPVALRETPISIVNRSGEDVQAIITLDGVPKTPLPAGGEGFSIERSYYTLDGEEADLAQAAQNERYLVVLKVNETNAWPSRVLVEDLLPAGFEIDNPRLVASADLSAFDWLPETNDIAHTEFRDDRFVAALDRTGSEARDITLAYVVRAVTPGRFAHPAARVEDMYRPHLQARTDTGTLTIGAPKP